MRDVIAIVASIMLSGAVYFVLRTHSPEEPVGNGCGICGGRLVTIRGRYPGDDRREVCPTCLQERIEHAMQTLNPETYIAGAAADPIGPSRIGHDE